MLEKIICDDCKYEFRLDSVKIKKSQVDCKGTILTLNFFTCPKCNKIYRVCLTDEKYDELLEDLNKSKKRIRRNFGSENVEFVRMLSNATCRKQSRLKKYVGDLNSKFKGTFTFNTSVNNKEEQTNIIYHE